MSNQRIVAELVLDDGKYTVRMNRAGKQARAFKRDMERLNKSVKRVEGRMKTATVAVRDWSIIIGQSRNVMHQLWFVTGRWMSSLINTSAEIERMTFLMKGMSKASTEAGKAAEAASNIKDLFSFAKNAPFTVNALSDSFVKFKSVGLDPLDGSMQSLVDATAAFGGTDETLHRASIAIQQMAGKGVISMEELRQQLGEAVPQAISIMAQSMGVGYGEMVKTISEGKLKAEPALKAMFTGFQIVFGGRAQSLMDSYNGRLAKMKTAWIELVTQSSGVKDFFAATKELWSSLTNLFNSDIGKEMMDGIGNALASFMLSVNSVVKNLEFAHAKFAAFFDYINSQMLNEDSFFGQIGASIKNALMDIKEFEDWVAANAGTKSGHYDHETPDGIKTNAFIDGYTETEIGLMQKILQRGNAIRSEEFDKALSAYDNHARQLRAKKAMLYAAEVDLQEALAGDTDRAARAGDDVFEGYNADQVAALNAGIDEKINDVHELSATIARLQKEISDGEAHNAKVGNGFLQQASVLVGSAEYADTATAQVELAKAKALYDQSVADRDTYIRQMVELDARLQQRANQPGLVDAFGDQPGPEGAAMDQATRLFNMLNSVNPEVAKLAQNWVKANAEVVEMERNVDAMAGTMSREFSEGADELAKSHTDAFNALKQESSAAAALMLKQASDVMQDSSLSSEEQFEEASRIAEAFYSTQIEGYETLGQAAIDTLIQQGVTGVEAAAIVRAAMALQVQSLIDEQTSILGLLKGGMITTGGAAGKGGGGKSVAARMEAMFETANREAETLKRRFLDPFAYEFPKAIDAARNKIAKLADKSGGKWTQDMKDLFKLMASNVMGKEMLKMVDATRDINRNLKGERAARNDIYDEETSRIRDMKAQMIEMGIWRVDYEQIVTDQIQALRDQLDAASGMGQYANEWKDLFDNISDWGADTFQSISQELADMVTEGEMNMEQLARSALNSFLQISINAAISGVTDLFRTGAKSILGGIMPNVAVNHGGGIAGMAGRSRSVPADAFAMAPKFHGGGIAGDEVPSILQKGEGVFTKEQMKAMGRGGGSGDVKVNLINNSGTQLDSESSDVRFNPDGMVLDVVLKNAARPGPFRDSLKRSLK